ncbi:TMEM175 family protein [Pediococcus acidilactici]
MNKARVEAFTDAVLAIILTIMILELKVPNSNQLSAILSELPYLFSYTVGYLLIGVAWYSHHYMFSKTSGISKRVYWANNFWMFTTSFIPMATAWIGRDLKAQGSEIFYAIVFYIWTAYLILSYVISNDDLKRKQYKKAHDIRKMKIYQYLTSVKYMLIQTILLIIILVFKPECLLAVVLWQILAFAIWNNDDSDKLF